MISIEADFSMHDLDDMINEDLNAWFQGLRADCNAAAKKFCDIIRNKQNPGDVTWNNRTWNLRSSIGYLIVFNGRIVDEYFPPLQGASEGPAEGKAYAQEIALLVNEGEGFQIVLVAGMEYAILVEDRNIDVLSHASEGFPKMWLDELNSN